MKIAQRLAHRRYLVAQFFGQRSPDRITRFGQRACHQTREQALANYRRQSVNGANSLWLAIRKPMQLRLDDLCSTVGGSGYTPANQHTLATRKIAVHVSRKIEPYEANLAPVDVEPSGSEPSPSRSTHRPFGNLPKVAFDDDDIPGAQIFKRRTFAPVLVTRWQMKNNVARSSDPTRFQSRRALRPNPRHRGNGTVNPKPLAF
jgi:hypothetical protein